MQNAKQFEKGETCEKSERGATIKEKTKERCWGGMVEKTCCIAAGQRSRSEREQQSEGKGKAGKGKAPKQPHQNSRFGATCENREGVK